MTIRDINDIIKAVCSNIEDYEKPCISPKYLRQKLEQLALEQEQRMLEPTTKNDLGVDCVARQDVERYIEGFINEYTSKEELEFINLELDGLKHIPSVTPQEPITWIVGKNNAQIAVKNMPIDKLQKICAIIGDEQEPVLDKIRAEIKELDIFYDSDYFSSNKDAMFRCNDVLQILDKVME